MVVLQVVMGVGCVSSRSCNNCSPCFTQYLCLYHVSPESKISPYSRNAVSLHHKVFVDHIFIAFLSSLSHHYLATATKLMPINFVRVG